MINVSELITDPDFAQTYSVWRKAGVWVKGRFVQTETELQFFGPILPTSVRDVTMVPEADRVNGMMTFFTVGSQPFLISRNPENEEEGRSDEPVWNGERYKILQVLPWQEGGYQKAIATRKAGD